MSARFAAITAGLLARKGEAQPWSQQMAQEMPDRENPPLLLRPEPAARPAVTPPPPGKDRSCSLRMSAQDYERLGILAVKTGSSRQQLLRQALDDLLAAKARTLSCACLGACEKNCG